MFMIIPYVQTGMKLSMSHDTNDTEFCENFK